MKPFESHAEGRTALNELTSTQTIITSLINDDGGHSQNDAIDELKTHVKSHEQSFVELERNDKDKTVSLMFMLYIFIILYIL